MWRRNLRIQLAAMRGDLPYRDIKEYVHGLKRAMLHRLKNGEPITYGLFTPESQVQLLEVLRAKSSGAHPDTSQYAPTATNTGMGQPPRRSRAMQQETTKGRKRGRR